MSDGMMLLLICILRIIAFRVVHSIDWYFQDMIRMFQ